MSGKETRSTRQAFPLWEFELTYELLQDRTQNIVPDSNIPTNELSPIVGLFLVCKGQHGRFYYSCPWDNSRTGQFIVTADGVTAEFRLKRSIAAPPNMIFEEYIGGIDPSTTMRVYVNGSESFTPTNWSLGADNNSIVFVSPPGAGAVVTADFSFFYFCRFLDDIQDYENFYHHLWTVKSLKFRSAKL